MTSFSVTLPDELAHAVDGEAHRRLVPQKQIIAEFFLRFWPIYQACRLHEDFAKAVWAPGYNTKPEVAYVEAAKAAKAAGAVEPGQLPQTRAEAGVA
jgi:hypothetical protein